jgi:hypothetical protein
MKNETEFKFIDGIFSSDEAAYILTALFDYKIDYHNREDFSNHIRFDQDLSHSKKRIDELITAKEAIKKLIDESKTSSSNLVIKSTVTISLEK